MTSVWNDVEIVIVGAGTMGASLAQNYAQNGFAVGLLDVSDAILQRGLGVIDAELNAARGKIFSPPRSPPSGGGSGPRSYEEACGGADCAW